MARIGRVHVRENQFGRGAGEIVLKLGGNERSAAGLDVQFIKLRFWSSAKHFAHADRPDSARNSRQRDVFDVESAIEKERKSRAELIDWNSACRKHFRISETVRK